MNSTLKSVIIFMSGAAVGATGMYLGVKKYFELKADLEIESVKDAYLYRLREIDDNKSSIDGSLEGPNEIELKETINRLNNKPDLTDYTKYFKEKGETADLDLKEVIRDAKDDIDPADLEHPGEDEPYSDEEDRDETLNYIDHELNGASRDAIAEDKAPYEIEPSDYELTCSNYEKQSLIYYQFDEILADEDENEVLDVGRLVGDILESSGFSDDDRDALYVRNDKIMVDFEITKLYESFRPGN